MKVSNHGGHGQKGSPCPNILGDTALRSNYRDKGRFYHHFSKTRNGLALCDGVRDAYTEQRSYYQELGYMRRKKLREGIWHEIY